MSMSGPRVTIDLERIETNARLVVETCRKSGIEVFGVTKGTCGMPQVARAMLRGGVIGIGESRFENIRRLQASGIDCPILLLRSPPLSLIEEVITSVDISLNSELAVIQGLSRVGERMSRVHDIILMVDLGDLREGIWPDDLEPMVERVVALPGVRIVGLGTNLTCFGAILPTTEKMEALAAHARDLERSFGLDLRYVSGGNSSSLPLLLAGGMPAGVNNLRIGEAILQGGRDTFHDEPWAALDRDAFLLSAELLEVKTKPSVPIGEIGVDAFGKRPVFVDKGDRLRGILNVGREDIVVDGLVPANAGVIVLGASSDHLVVDVTETNTDTNEAPEVGDRLGFHMDYGALLAAMTSEYVEKEPMLDKEPKKRASRVSILAEKDLLFFVDDADLVKRFAALGLEATVIDVSPGEPEIGIASTDKETLLLLGADHTITLTGLQGLSRTVDAFGLLWFDATASFMPPTGGGDETPADMVLYRALGYDEAVPGLKPQLSPENVVLIGLRDVSAREAEIIKDSRVAAFTIADVDALGIREVMRQALHIAMAGTRGFYASYCPAVTDLPGVENGSGGITLRETHQAMEIIAQTRAMLAMDLIGIEAGRERRLMTEAANFIMSCFGKQIL
jgi:predicted amino acid racemase/arginase family enzyme